MLKKELIFVVIMLGLTLNSIPTYAITRDSISHDHFTEYSFTEYSFTENSGQWDERVLFSNQATDKNLWITENSMVFDFTYFENKQSFVDRLCTTFDHLTGTLNDDMDRYDQAKQMLIRGHVLRFVFDETSSSAKIFSDQPADYYQNYITGSEANNSISNVQSYKKVGVDDIYPGINVRYYYNGGNLEYDFEIAPEADPAIIRFHIEGNDNATIDEYNNLIIKLSLWDCVQSGISAYQKIDGEIIKVSCHFKKFDKNSFGFTLGDYNHNYPLVIDPIIYSTYLGGTGNEWSPIFKPNGLKVDSAGCSYVTGCTLSSNFPTTSGAYDASYNGDSLFIATPETGGTSYYWKTGDIFVTKINKEGTGLVYSTFIGGRCNDMGNDIAIDSLGNAYVTGMTCSGDFPTTSTAYARVFRRGAVWANDVIALKLNPQGTDLIYSTYIGGISDEQGMGICIDNDCNAIITGFTTSGGYPTTPNAYSSTLSNTLSDAFITKINSTGSDLFYSTFWGGIGKDEAHSIAVKGNDVYITGFTESNNFPTSTSGYNSNYISANGKEAFFSVLSLGATGATVKYSTYFGGIGSDCGNKVCVDDIGNAIVGGWTYSLNLSTSNNAYQTAYGGNCDGFLLKIDPNLTGSASKVYCTYYGGNGADSINCIALDGAGSILLTGITSSTNLPLAGYNPYQTANLGLFDAFLGKISPNGNGTSDLVYSIYLGGTQTDIGLSVASCHYDNAIIFGMTNSIDFPMNNYTAFRKSNSGGFDMFLTKILVSNNTYVDFFNPDTVCINQPVPIINISDPAPPYEWSFIEPDYSADPIKYNMGNPLSIDDMFTKPELVKDGNNYYVFFGNYFNGNVYRLSYGSNINGTPTVKQFELFGGPAATNLPFMRIRFVKDNGNWYGVAAMGSNSNAALRIINFGNSLSNNPTTASVRNLGNFSNVINDPYDICVVKEGNNWVTFVLCSPNTIVRLVFGASMLSNTPSVSIIDGSQKFDGALGFDVCKFDEKWVMFIVCRYIDHNRMALVRYVFNGSVLSTPTFIIDSLSYIVSYDVNIIKNCNKNIALLTNMSPPNMSVLDFGSDVTGAYSTRLVTFPEGSFSWGSTRPVEVGDSIVFFTTGLSSYNNFLYSKCTIKPFQNTVASLRGSTDRTPVPVSYSEPGDYQITLKTNAGLPNENVKCKTVTVLGNIDAKIFGDSSVCEGSYKKYYCNKHDYLTAIWIVTGGIARTPINQDTIIVEWSSLGTRSLKLIRTNNKGCDNSNTINITTIPAPPVNLQGNLFVCLNSTEKYYGERSGTIADDLTYTWSVQGGTITSQPAEDTIYVNWDTFITGKVILTVTDNVTGCISYWEFENIMNLPPTPHAGNDTSVCQGKTIKIGKAATDGTPPYTYFWTSSAGTFDNPALEQPTVTPDVSGMYFVTVTDDNGCSSVDSMKIDIVPAITIDLGADITICNSADTIIGRSPTGGLPPYTYSWLPITGLTDPSAKTTKASPVTTTKYFLTIIDALNCSTIDSITIIVNPQIVISTLPEITVCPDSTEKFAISTSLAGSYSVNWVPSVGLDDPTKLQPNFSLHDPGNYSYIVTITDRFNCIQSAEQRVQVRSIPQLSSDANQVNFGELGDCTSSTDTTITITNSSSDEFTITDYSIDPPFAIISPSIPIKIPSGDNRTIKIRFSPTIAGSFNGKLSLNCSPCGYSFELPLSGEKLKMIVSTSLSVIEFPREPFCGNNVSMDSSFSIINNGTENVLLKFSQSSPGLPFELVNPTTDITVAAGTNQKVDVRFIGTSSGAFNEQLVIPYQAGACNDTLKVNLTATITNPKAELSLNKVDFPALRGCDNSTDTVITVYNTGDDNVTITSFSPNNVFSINPKPPFSIASADSIKVTITYSPVGNGTFSGQFELFYLPCNYATSLDFTSSKESILFYAEDTVDLGEIIECRDLSKIVQFRIENRSSGDFDGIITEVTQPANHFVIDTKAGDTLLSNDYRDYSVTFTTNNSDPIGMYYGTAKLKFSPCDSVIAINYKIKKVTVNVESIGFNAGQVRNGETKTGFVDYVNKSPVPITISHINGIEPPFEILSASPPVPASLGANDTLRVEIQYSAVTEGTQTLTITAVSIDPCDVTTDAVLSGECLPAMAYKSSIAIENDSAKIGDRINLPLLLTNSLNTKYSDFAAYEAVISYNSSVLEPIDFLATGTDKIRSILIEKSWNPLDTIGKLSDIWFNTALGDAECSQVVIESFRWKSALQCNIDYSPAQFCLTNLCKDGGARLIDPNGKIEVKSIKPNPFDETAEIELVVLEKGWTKLTITNLLGEFVQSLYEGDVTAGTILLKADANHLSTGSYYLRLETPTVMKTYKIEVVK